MSPAVVQNKFKPSNFIKERVSFDKFRKKELNFSEQPVFSRFEANHYKSV